MVAGQDLQALILRLAGSMAKIETEAAAQFSPPLAASELTALRFIAQQTQVRMRDLAQNVGVPQSTATNLADKLIARGLVARARPETNRRVVTLSLTDASMRLISEIEGKQVALCDELVAGLGPAHADVLRQILGRVSTGPSPSQKGK